MRSLAVTNFLLETYPLIRLTRGEKRVQLQRAWIAAADETALAILRVDASLLPASPLAATKALLAAVIKIARDQGMSGADLADYFNERADAGELMLQVEPDDSLQAAHALLAMMAARRLQARDPISNDRSVA